MSSVDAVKAVLETLNRLGVPYMLSANVYGIESTTRDADFVIATDECINQIRAALAAEFVLDPQMGFETKQLTTKYVFHHRQTQFQIEFFLLSAEEYDQARFARRQRVERAGLIAYFPTAEDVIVQKLRWGRRKDQADVADIVEVRGDRLDWGYIVGWCERHGTRALLEAIRADPSAYE